MVSAAMKLKDTPWKKSYDQPRQHIKKQRHYFANKGFSSSHVWMWELDYKENWVLKKWCFWNCGVGEDSWESLGLQGDPTIPKISPEYSLEGLVLKLKLQYFGHLMWRIDSFEKTLMLGKIKGRRSRGQTIIFGWHHQLDGQEFE